MTYYHPSKDAALAAGKRYQTHWEYRAEFDPYNGWVVVLKPKTWEVFNWPFGPVLAEAEIDLSNCVGEVLRRLRRPPVDRIKPEPLEKKPAPPKPSAPPPRPPSPGATKPATPPTPPPPPPGRA